MVAADDDELPVACQRCWEMVFVYNTNDSILGRIPLVSSLPLQIVLLF